MITTLSLLLAFNKLTRALLSFTFNVSWAWLQVYITPYVSFSGKRSSGDQIKHIEKVSVNEIKKKALEREVERREASRLRQRKKEDIQSDTSDHGRTNSYDDENFGKEA
jgi:hypothetical protein